MEKDKEVLGTEDLQQMLGLKGWFGRQLSALIVKALELDKVNDTARRYQEFEGPAFSQKILEDVGVTFHIPEGQLERIPQEGGFITVSNHPYGSIDGLILSHVVGGRRPDYKLLTTFLLSRIPNLESSFMGVDNLSSSMSAQSVNGIRKALTHIQGGHPMGFFPAGEVATWQPKDRRTALRPDGKKVIEDRPWAENIIKLIRKSGFPVIPIYFSGTNSNNFHWLGRIHPRLRTIRLIHELFNKKGHHVEVRIGQPIQPEEMEKMDVATLGKYLRNRTYALEAQCQPPAAKLAAVEKMAPIVEPEDPELLRGEIDRIQDRMLLESAPYRLYFTGSEDIPHIMRELGRLREIVFRGVGEGTGTPMDTDQYDKYYKHLILWHMEDQQIAGAYRIGIGSELMARPEGSDAFYTASLFRFQEGLKPYLPKAMELGRTIIVDKYQRDVLPLKLLLSGILTAGARTPGMEYTLGPASISNDLPDFYKSLIVHYFRTHCSMPDAANIVRSTHPFQPCCLRVNPDQLLCGCQTADELDRLICAISDGGCRLPVLLRKYVSFGAKMVEFNVDPLFNNSLDGFILLWIHDMPDNSFRAFSRFLTQEEIADLSKRVQRS